MTHTAQIAKHFREVHFGGNWTWVNLRDTLADVTWKEATTKLYTFNTIGTLVFHINYYVGVAMKVLQGGPLEGHDKLSFDAPPLTSQEDWEHRLDKYSNDATEFAGLVELLPDEKLWDVFEQEKYGNYYRNLLGIIEHSHYHLGQIVIIKKLIREGGQQHQI